MVSAPNEVATIYGRLSADAAFNLAINGGAAVEVTIAKSATDANNTVDDLVADVTAALSAAGLSGQVTASRDGQKLVLSGAGSVTSLALTALNGNPAVTQMGFRASQTAVDEGGILKIRAAADVSGLVGRLTSDAVFQVTMNGVNGGSPVTVTVDMDDTAGQPEHPGRGGRRAAGHRRYRFGGQDRGGLPGQTADPLRHRTRDDQLFHHRLGNRCDAGWALASTNTGNSADLIITTRDNVTPPRGTGRRTTLGQVIGAIEDQTGNDVDVQYTDDNTRLALMDTSGGTTATFQVENAFGSTAALDLGILGADTNQPEETPDQPV